MDRQKRISYKGVTCNVDGCNRPALSRGMCSKHYNRAVRGKDPNYTSQREPRHAIVEGDTAKIPLGVNAKDGYAIVDADFSWIDKYNWSKEAVGYATARIDGKSKKMHHIILPKKQGFETDHINNIRHDNRRVNLRYATRSQNCANRLKSSNNTSGYKGVHHRKDTGKWTSTVVKDIRQFSNKESAMLDYNQRLSEQYGEYAKGNNI